MERKTLTLAIPLRESHKLRSGIAYIDVSNPFHSSIVLTFPSFIPRTDIFLDNISVCVKKGGKDTATRFPMGRVNRSVVREPALAASRMQRCFSPMVINKTPTDMRKKRISRRQSPWQQ